MFIPYRFKFHLDLQLGKFLQEWDSTKKLSYKISYWFLELMSRVYQSNRSANYKNQSFNRILSKSCSINENWMNASDSGHNLQDSQRAHTFDGERYRCEVKFTTKDLFTNGFQDFLTSTSESAAKFTIF